MLHFHDDQHIEKKVETSPCDNHGGPARRGYYGGIEGGASSTKIVLLDEQGRTVAEDQIDLSTNHWQIGLMECLNRINDLTNRAKAKAEIGLDVPLITLGMSLSGADNEESSRSIEEGLKSQYPNLSEHYTVCCDTVGSIATLSPTGGIVLIAGTGSNCQLINPNEERFRCGGWGHMMGDEGGAYWIAHYVVKTVFDSMDNLVPTPFDVKPAFNLMCSYFKVTDQMAMLEHLYTKFQKTVFAGLTREIATVARETRDPLCVDAFHRAGKILAWHIHALLPQADPIIVEGEGGVHVACIGSVFHSWDLLKDGFIAGLVPRSAADVTVKEITLLTLNKPSTYGAAYLGAKHAGIVVPADYSKNSTPFFTYKLEERAATNGTAA